MIWRLIGAIAAFGAATLFPASEARAWDPNSSLIVFSAGNRCLSTDGRELMLRDCNSGDTRQRWALTAGNELRSPHYEDRCIGTSRGAFTKGTRLVLATCNGFRDQQWKFLNKSKGALSNTGPGKLLDTVLGTVGIDTPVEDTGLIQSAQNKCIDVPAGNTSNANRLIIWDCSDRNRNQLFKTSVLLRNVVSSARASDLGFDNYRECNRRKSPKCWMRIRAIDLWKFGFYTGGGHGAKDWLDPTLDFGDELSVDYCAKIHDHAYASYHADRHGKAWADYSLVNCSAKARPVTAEEKEARANVVTIFTPAHRIVSGQDAVIRETADMRWWRGRTYVDCLMYFRDVDKAKRDAACNEFVAQFDRSSADFDRRHRSISAKFAAAKNSL